MNFIGVFSEQSLEAMYQRAQQSLIVCISPVAKRELYSRLSEISAALVAKRAEVAQ
jgi:hypothetical protein